MKGIRRGPKFTATASITKNDRNKTMRTALKAKAVQGLALYCYFGARGGWRASRRSFGQFLLLFKIVFRLSGLRQFSRLERLVHDLDSEALF
jgi:hypothetical protein